MIATMKKLGVAMALAGALSACTHSAPVWESSFGQSVRTAVALQTVNPDAVRNTDPVAGIDGRAAVAAQKRYDASFRAPAAVQPALTGMDR